MENIKEEFKKTLFEYTDIYGNKIEPLIIEKIINNSSESELEKFLIEDKKIRKFSKDYIDFSSIVVGIVLKEGPIPISKILKKIYY